MLAIVDNLLDRRPHLFGFGAAGAEVDSNINPLRTSRHLRLLLTCSCNSQRCPVADGVLEGSVTAVRDEHRAMWQQVV